MYYEEISEENLNEFFVAVDEDILKRRESYKIEFKKTFEWENKKIRSKYLKTMAAYANNSGGLILFGIDNLPHKIIGINNFDSVDDADISNAINDSFNQEIKFVRKEYKYQDKIIGIMQIFESLHKPVICIKDFVEINASEIYYRYNSKSAKICAGELNEIIDNRVNKEKSKWMSLLNNIAKVGIDKIGIMNVDDGEIQFAGNRVIIDEELLSKLKIIDEYSQELDGAPALCLKGEITSKATIINQPYIIDESDIFKAFLGKIEVNDSIQFLKCIYQQYSNSYPIWFFLSKISSNKEEIIKKLADNRLRTDRYNKLLNRIELDELAKNLIGKYSLKTQTRGKLRVNMLNKFRDNQEINYSDEEEIRTLLEAFFSINPNEVEFLKIQNVVGRAYDNSYPFSKSAYNYLFRDALTVLDYLYFSKGIN